MIGAIPLHFSFFTPAPAYFAASGSADGVSMNPFWAGLKLRRVSKLRFFKLHVISFVLVASRPQSASRIVVPGVQQLPRGSATGIFMTLTSQPLSTRCGAGVVIAVLTDDHTGRQTMALRSCPNLLEGQKIDEPGFIRAISLPSLTAGRRESLTLLNVAPDCRVYRCNGSMAAEYF